MECIFALTFSLFPSRWILSCGFETDYLLAVLMDNSKAKDAIAEISRAISFKADLPLHAAFHEHLDDIMGALRDCRVALSVDPSHQEMLELHSRVDCQEP